MTAGREPKVLQLDAERGQCLALPRITLFPPEILGIEGGQILYPRAAIFREVVEVFRRYGRTAPVFVAKHLSYSFDLANEMAHAAEAHGIPLMAGSAWPSAGLRPELPLGPGRPIRDV